MKTPKTMRFSLVVTVLLLACAPTGAAQSAAQFECSDGIDNDGDGLVDYGVDPDCEKHKDRSEAGASPSPACSDGADNDGDAQVDYPADPGCTSADDPDEGNAPMSGCSGRNVTIGRPQLWPPGSNGWTPITTLCLPF